MKVLAEIMDGVPAPEVEQLTSGNVIKLYRIDRTALPAA